MKVNGEEVEPQRRAGRTLLLYLRNELGLRGTRVGCATGSCGACTVLINGRPEQSCVTPLSSVEDAEIVTIEGLADGDALSPVQQAILDGAALQCGYCISGIVMSATALLRRSPRPSRMEIACALSRNLCRCGAHLRILRAVELAAAASSEQDPPSR